MMFFLHLVGKGIVRSKPLLALHFGFHGPGRCVCHDDW